MVEEVNLNIHYVDQKFLYWKNKMILSNYIILF